MNEPPNLAVHRLINRRALIGVVGGGAAAILAACSDSASSSTSTAGTTAATTADTTAATAATVADTTAATAGATDSSTATPSETGGPFPADGTNDNGAGAVADVLADTRSVRSDIRSDLDGSNTQPGVPLTLEVTVVQQGSGTALPGHAVYIWHCNKDGQYSEYNSSMLGGDFSARSFLRGVQVTDDSGKVTFTSILPGRYQGRAFHIHFEVFENSGYTNKVLTSQMAIDDTLIDDLYTQIGDAYASALRNDTDNARDGIFGDGVDHQLLTVSGDVTSGLTATFTAVVA